MGYKSLAQMPSRRNGPVSSNVSHHHETFVQPQRQQTQDLRKHMRANAANTKEKGISSPMALRAVATERVIGSTNTALRRGEVRLGRSIAVSTFECAAKCGGKFNELFGSNGQQLKQKQIKSKSENDNTVASGLHQRSVVSSCSLKLMRQRWQSTILSNYASVLANPSLNRTHCGVPPFGL